MDINQVPIKDYLEFVKRCVKLALIVAIVPIHVFESEENQQKLIDWVNKEETK